MNSSWCQQNPSMFAPNERHFWEMMGFGFRWFPSWHQAHGGNSSRLSSRYSGMKRNTTDRSTLVRILLGTTQFVIPPSLLDQSRQSLYKLCCHPRRSGGATAVSLPVLPGAGNRRGCTLSTTTKATVLGLWLGWHAPSPSSLLLYVADNSE